MAALLARALCLPFELLSRGLDAGCAALGQLRCPACCGACGDCGDRLLRGRGSLCVAFTACFSLVPGLASLAWAAAAWPSAADCAASDGLGVRALPLQSWLAGHFALALCHAVAALHVWRHFQRPFNARDPRDVDCVARATWLACYDPGVALGILAEIVQFAWLVIGTRLTVLPPRAGADACSPALQAGFSAIVVVGWFFFVVGGAALIAGYFWACTCGRVDEAWAEDAAAAQARAHAQAQAQAQQAHAYHQQGVYQQGAAVAVGGGPYQAGAVEGLPVAQPVPAGMLYAPPMAGAGAGAAHVAVPLAHAVNEWPHAQPVPMAQAVAGPPGAGGGGAAPYYAGGGGHVNEPAAVVLARAGLGLLGGGLRAGAAAVGAVAEAARHAAEQHRAQQVAEQNAAARAYAEQQNRRY